MDKENIMIIKTCKRKNNADQLQKTLTEFGCIIKMRLGLHEAGDVCSDEGLIILQLVDDDGEIEKLEKSLDGIEGLKFKTVSV